jgi:hypothetical protein
MKFMHDDFGGAKHGLTVTELSEITRLTSDAAEVAQRAKFPSSLQRDLATFARIAIADRADLSREGEAAAWGLCLRGLMGHRARLLDRSFGVAKSLLDYLQPTTESYEHILWSSVNENDPYTSEKLLSIFHSLGYPLSTFEFEPIFDSFIEQGFFVEKPVGSKIYYALQKAHQLEKGTPHAKTVYVVRCLETLVRNKTSNQIVHFQLPLNCIDDIADTKKNTPLWTSSSGDFVLAQTLQGYMDQNTGTGLPLNQPGIKRHFGLANFTIALVIENGCNREKGYCSKTGPASPTEPELPKMKQAIAFATLSEAMFNRCDTLSLRAAYTCVKPKDQERFLGSGELMNVATRMIELTKSKRSFRNNKKWFNAWVFAAGM